MNRASGAAARNAARIIEKWGWAQLGWRDDRGGYCIRGAFNQATYGIVAMHPSLAEQEFTDWLRKLGIAPKGKPLEDWNDASARTKDEVLTYLNKFAEEQDPQPVLP